MNRQEFLDGLYRALAGEVSEEKRQSDIRYYRDYIAEEVSKGRSEEDVLAELGDPRLIARTIVDAAAAGEERRGYSYSDGNNAEYAYREAAQEAPEYDSASAYQTYAYDDTQQDYEHDLKEDVRGKVITLSGLKASLIIGAVIVVILVLLSFVFSVTLRILSSPVFWIALAGYMVYRALSGRSGWF